MCSKKCTCIIYINKLTCKTINIGLNKELILYHISIDCRGHSIIIKYTYRYVKFKSPCDSRTLSSCNRTVLSVIWCNKLFFEFLKYYNLFQEALSDWYNSKI